MSEEKRQKMTSELQEYDVSSHEQEYDVLSHEYDKLVRSKKRIEDEIIKIRARMMNVIKRIIIEGYSDRGSTRGSVEGSNRDPTVGREEGNRNEQEREV